MAIRAVLAVALLTALPACKQSSADRATANPTVTVATEPAPTTTTNPYAVPAVIDVAYVNRVLAGLDAAMGDVVRLIVKTRTIPREAYDRLRAIYGDDEWLQASLDSFQTDARSNFSTYRANIGNKTTSVGQMISANSRCIFARVTRDYSSVSVTPTLPETQWVALKPININNDPHGYNPTAWALVYDGYAPNRQAPPDPCAA